MRATGAVRRIDDLGRVVIPMNIRKSMNLREGDPLEFFLEKDGIFLKKSFFEEKPPIAKSCANWVNKNKDIIASVLCIGDKTVCTFKIGKTVSSTAEVKRHNSDAFDLNIAICYCAVKCGFTVEGI